MAIRTIGQSDQEVACGTTTKTQVASSTHFDWAVVGVSGWVVIGAHADAWAHNHLPLDNFFTPWHGVLYSGVLAATLLIIGTFIRNVREGMPWHRALPVGYELSLLGVLIVLFGGVGDMCWHILFGIEKNIDAMLSPTHIALTVGMILIISGPFRVAWHRRDTGTHFRALLPMILSFTFMLSMFTLLTQLFHPFVHISANLVSKTDALGAVSIVLQTIILMSLVLLAVRRWRLPFGTFTLMFTFNMILLSFMQDHYIMIPVAASAGFVADVLNWRLKPSVDKPDTFRLFAFAVPIILYVLYFLTIELTMGIGWSIHMWMGTTFVAGITGFALSYLLLPPKLPEEAKG